MASKVSKTVPGVDSVGKENVTVAENSDVVAIAFDKEVEKKKATRKKVTRVKLTVDPAFTPSESINLKGEWLKKLSFFDVFNTPDVVEEEDDDEGNSVFVRHPMMTPDGHPILSRLRSRWDRFSMAVQRKAPKNEVQWYAGAYEREINLTLRSMLRVGINARDSKDITSGFFVGVLGYRHKAIEDMGTSKARLGYLAPWQVGIHPDSAKDMGIKPGDKVLLYRFPVTYALVMEAVITTTCKPHVVHLPIGKMDFWGNGKPITVPTILGGDTDGDCYCLRAVHRADLKLAFGNTFKKQWSRCQRVAKMVMNKAMAVDNKPVLYYNYLVLDESDTVLNLKDEQPLPVMDSEELMALSLIQQEQKAAIGPTTIRWYAANAVKGMVPQAIPLTYEQIRKEGEAAIEAVMDRKKDENRIPLLWKTLMNQSSYKVFDEYREHLPEQGHDPEVIETLLDFAVANSMSIRRFARLNVGFDAITGWPDPTKMRKVMESLPKTGAANLVLSTIVGDDWIESAPKRKAPKTDLGARARRGRQFTAISDPETHDIHIMCGEAQVTFVTSDGGATIRVSEDTKVLWRPTVAINWQTREDEVSGKKTYIPHATVLSNWGQLITYIGRRDHGFGYAEIRAQDDVQVANDLLIALVTRILLGKPAKAYVMEDDNTFSWCNVAGSQQIVVLEFRTPDPYLDELESEKLMQLALQKGYEAAFKQGWVNRPTDTKPGKPMYAYWMRVDDSPFGERTFVTQYVPLAHLSPPKRARTLNALANLVELQEGSDTSIDLGLDFEMPTRELTAVCLPICSDGCVMVSESLAWKLGILVKDTQASMEKGTDVYKTVALQEGSKIQGRGVDLKGVARVMPDELMPHVRYKDGRIDNVDVVFSLNSKSHHEVAMTIGTMALTAYARRKRLATETDENGNQEVIGSSLRITRPIGIDDITKVVCGMGMYEKDLLVDVLSGSGRFIGRYPGGVVGIGVHRQTPDTISQIHKQEPVPEDSIPTGTRTGGITLGLAGMYVLKSIGLDCIVDEVWANIPLKLRNYIDCLTRSVVYSDIKPEEKKPVSVPNNLPPMEGNNI